MILNLITCLYVIGNCVVLKPSEVSANTAHLLAEIIPKYFDNVSTVYMVII